MRSTRPTLAVLSLLVLSLLVSMAATPTATAIDLQEALSSYSINSWVEYDGRPIGPTRAIVQDADGYLWLGTETGLLRFDGVRFANAESLGLPTLPGLPIRALLKGSDRHTLWIGFAEGGGVRRLRDGTLEPMPDTLASLSVTSLAMDPAGTIWAATDHGVFYYGDSHWHHEVIAASGLEPSTFRVYVDHRGTVLVGTSAGVFRRVSADHYERVGESHSVIRDLGEDTQGRLWATDPAEGFRVESTLASVHHRDGIGIRVFQDHFGNMWIGTRGQGLWRIRAGGNRTQTAIETATVETGLVSNGISDIMEDRESNIWIGTQRGLTRLTPYSVTAIVDLGLVRSVEARADGRVSIGTARGLFNLRADSAGRGFSHAVLQAPEVRALHEGLDRTLWLATDDRPIRVLHERAVPASGIPSHQLGGVRSMAGDGPAGLWLVNQSGELYRWAHTGLSSVAVPADQPIAFVYKDTHERLWIAFQGGRLGVIERGRAFRFFTADQGLTDGTHAVINAISEAPDGTIWIGGSGGLTRFKNDRFVTLTRRTGLPGQRVTATILDNRGYLWLGLGESIVRLHPDEFDKAAVNAGYRMHHEQLDQVNGLAGVPIPSNNEGVARATDGTLWFVTGRGLTIIDPSVIGSANASSAPQVRIEGAVADESRFSATGDTGLPPRTTRLRIDYTALQLTTPTRIRFRYRLEGFDSNWIEAGTRRQAYYMNLQPRSYRFLVQATNNDGQWVDARTSWNFSIQPTFYQTFSFRLAGTTALALCGWGAWQLRLRRIRRQFAMVLAERARLSRELHDVVLQNLAGVAIQCAGISNTIEASSVARGQLDLVRFELESQLREMRRAVWNLRAPILETYDLPDALRETAKRVIREAPIRFELRVSGKPRRFAPELENEILRIGQEAIANAVQHASASRILIHLQFEPRALVLRVSDDGNGFHAKRVDELEGHFGLLGMKERAAQLGAILKIDAGPTGGTDVELVVPSVLRFAES